MHKNMFSLVRFDNEETGIYPSSKIRKLEGIYVTASHKSKGRFRAKLLCENSNETFLHHLDDDIKNKRFQIPLIACNSLSPSVRLKLLEEDMVSENNFLETSNLSSPSARKKLFGESTMPHCNFDEYFPKSLEPINSELKGHKLEDYDILEKIYQKKNSSTMYQPIAPDFYDLSNESNSGSEWLPDEEEEQEQSMCQSPSKPKPSALTSQTSIVSKDIKNLKKASTPEIKILQNISILPASTSTSEDILHEENIINGNVVTSNLSNMLSETVTFRPSVIIEDYRELDDINQSINGDPVVLAEVQLTRTDQGNAKKKKRNAKKHSCLFCTKLVFNLNRHMKALHPEEEGVKVAINASHQFLMDARKRNSGYKGHNAFEALRKRGDLQHNHENNFTNIITVRNSPKPNETSFVSCPLCKGCYSKKCFRIHFRNCRMQPQNKDKDNNIKNVIGAARVNGQSVNKKASPELVKHFFPYFTKLEQAKVLFNDDTAVQYANKLVTKYYRTNAGGSHHIHIASQLRLLADIFNSAKNINHNLKCIADLIHPEQYDTVIEAIQLRCGYNNGIFKAPTTATNCCTLLLKVTKFLKCEALKIIDRDAEKRYTNFEYLLVNSQNQDITRQAHDNKTELQRQKQEILPSTEEINCLLNVLVSEVSKAYEKAANHLNRETYSSLAKSTLAYLLAFNRKRPGDVEKTQLLEIVSMTKVNAEHLMQLPDDDKRHAEQFARYITQGKLNKKVSNLIPIQAKNAIDCLIENRQNVGISIQNKYIFARPDSSSSRVPYFKADEALRIICEKNNLDYSKLNANKLRKHLATCTSMLPPNVQTVISDFMGHSMSVHKNIYQQKEAHTDIVVMGKVLLEASGVKQTAVNTLNVNTSCPDLQENNEVPSNIYPENLPSSSKHDIYVQEISSKRNSDGNNLSTILEEEESCATLSNLNIRSKIPLKSKPRIMKTISRPKRTWLTPEKKEIRRIFQDYINDLEVPSIHQVQVILTAEGHTVTRNATGVRSWITAEINRIKRSQEGAVVQRWTTPERHKIREYFKPYFDICRETKTRIYPTNEELKIAAKTVPEFENKNSTLLRAKIQHEFGNIEKHVF